MTFQFKALTIAPFLALVLSYGAYAGPSAPTAPPQGEDRPITRSELINDIERILSRWEEQTDTYATKEELGELQMMVEEMRAELGSSQGQEGGLEQSVDALQQRIDHLRRPGF